MRPASTWPYTNCTLCSLSLRGTATHLARFTPPRELSLCPAEPPSARVRRPSSAARPACVKQKQTAEGGAVTQQRRRLLLALALAVLGACLRAPPPLSPSPSLSLSLLERRRPRHAVRYILMVVRGRSAKPNCLFLAAAGSGSARWKQSHRRRSLARPRPCLSAHLQPPFPL